MSRVVCMKRRRDFGSTVLTCFFFTWNELPLFRLYLGDVFVHMILFCFTRIFLMKIYIKYNIYYYLLQYKWMIFIFHTRTHPSHFFIIYTRDSRLQNGGSRLIDNLAVFCFYAVFALQWVTKRINENLRLLQNNLRRILQKKQNSSKATLHAFGKRGSLPPTSPLTHRILLVAAKKFWMTLAYDTS